MQFSSEVTVTTANRRQEVLLKAADPVVLIDRTQIEDAGARSAKDVLLDQAGQGVIVNQGGGPGARVDQRHPELGRAGARRRPA